MTLNDEDVSNQVSLAIAGDDGVVNKYIRNVEGKPIKVDHIGAWANILQGDEGCLLTVQKRGKVIIEEIDK